MSLLCYLILVVLVGTSMATKSATVSNVKKAFEDSELVPDVISKAPEKLLQLLFLVSFAGDIKANLGNELTIGQTGRQPNVLFAADSTAKYTIVMSDPDAPSRTNARFREWRHWVRVNVRGDDPTSGDTLTDYAGPTPPANTGLHRYVLLVYNQTADVPTTPISDARGGWKVATFAQQHRMGDPVFGNFFQVKRT